MDCSKHIDDLASLGPRVCQSFTHFEFNYEDVSYESKNEQIVSITNADALRLAKKRPHLKKVKIQGTANLTDHAVHAFSNTART